MENLITLARNSVEGALFFYASHGTPLTYIPKINYTDSYHPQLKDVVAIVKNEPESTLKIITEFGEITSDTITKVIQQIFSNDYSLNISITSINEMFNTRIEHMPPTAIFSGEYFDSDILLFKPFLKFTQNKKAIDALISHEIWHLIEDEQIGLSTHPFIIEGTATYAMNRFIENKSGKSITQCQNAVELLYQGVEQIVKNTVQNSEKPFKDILNPLIRNSIQERCISEILPTYSKLVENNTMQDTELKKKLIFDILLKPLNSTHRKNNIENNSVFLEICRNAGYYQTANELENQNLDKLINFYNLYFNKTHLEK